MNEEVRKASAQASALNEAAQKIELHNAAEQLGSLCRSVPCTLVARGVALRQLTLAQAMAGLEAAEEALRFIVAMEITVNGEQILEPISRWEARAGLAKVLKAIEDAGLDSAATPRPGTQPETGRAEPA